MQICIHRQKLGTQKNLLYNTVEKDFCWTDAQPEGVWSFGGPDFVLHDLGVIASLLNRPVSSMAASPQIRAYRQLGFSGAIPWQKVLPNKVFQASLVSLISNLESILDEFLASGYGDTFIIGRKVISHLSRASIDVRKHTACVQHERNPTLKKILSTFSPNKQYMAPTVQYSQVDTLTGRLVVESGPQVLTLPKKYRDILGSRYSNGKLLYIDFVSLEPRTALFASGRLPPQDIYHDISEQTFAGAVPRDTVKLAVFCALFGAGSARLSEVLPPDLGLSPSQIITRIRQYFGADELTKTLRRQADSLGHTNNMFGRKIQLRDNSNLLNHFLQSSAVDVAMLGFAQIIEKINKLLALPIFVIHDALLLDCAAEDVQEVISLIKEGVTLPAVGQFPVSIDVITPEGE